MGRIAGSVARRRALVGLVAVGALVLAGCVGLKPGPPPPGGGADLPNVDVCVPVGTPGPAPQAAQPGDQTCLPICLPGQEPPNLQRPFLDPGQQEVPSCVPLCPIGTGGGQPQMNAQLGRQCLAIPIPCLPGQGASPSAVARAVQQCVNFCLPGQEPQPPQAFTLPGQGSCVPLCVFARIIHGLPGLDPCPNQFVPN